MRELHSRKSARYFYIARDRDGALCGGIAPNDGSRMRSLPIWRMPNDFEWARRFLSVESAVQYTKLNHIYGVSVIDRGGTVLYVRAEEGEVLKRA